MSSWTVKKMCLSCRFYRLRDEKSGVCRVAKDGIENYPLKLNEDICGKWKDCGQQYYIRTGWIKGRLNSSKEEGEN